MRPDTPKMRSGSYESYVDLRPSTDESELYAAPRRGRLSNASLDPFRSFPFLDSSPTDTDLPYSYPSTPVHYKHVREPEFKEARPKTRWSANLRLPRRDDWDWPTARWPLVLGLFFVLDLVYLLIAIVKYHSQALLEGNGHFRGEMYRPIGIALFGSTIAGSDYSNAHNGTLRVFFSAAVIFPTITITWLVKRLHLLRARQGTTSNKNLETPTWLCHVSYQNHVNYTTSAFLFVVVVLTHTAASLVFCQTIMGGGFVQAENGSGQTEVQPYTSVIYCPLAMIFHSLGLLLLAIWSIRLISTLQRPDGMCLRQQLGPPGSSPYAQTDGLSASTSPTLSRPPYVKFDSDSSIEETMSILYQDKLMRPLSRTPGRDEQAAFMYPPVPGSPYRQPLRRHSARLLSVAAITAFLGMTVALSAGLAQGASSGESFSLEITLDKLVHAPHPLYLRFPLHFAPLVSFSLSALLLGLFFTILELFTHAVEIVIYRRWWESLWRARKTGRVHSETEVESLRAGRWYFATFVMLSALEFWTLSNAAVVASYRPHPEDPARDYTVGLWPLASGCVLFALVIVVHAAVAGVLIWRARGSEDMTSWGDKAVWRQSGVAHAEKGWRWGAMNEPKLGEVVPGILGWGEKAVDPMPGMYIWVNG